LVVNVTLPVAADTSLFHSLNDAIYTHFSLHGLQVPPFQMQPQATTYNNGFWRILKIGNAGSRSLRAGRTLQVWSGRESHITPAGLSQTYPIASPVLHPTDTFKKVILVGV